MTADNITTVPVHYDKSKFFRVIHVDGFYGGVSPDASLHCSPYNERFPLPNTGEFKVDAAGNLISAEVPTDRKNGIFRELEADLVIDIGPAIALESWLREKIGEMADKLGMSEADLSAMREKITGVKK